MREHLGRIPLYCSLARGGADLQQGTATSPITHVALEWELLPQKKAIHQTHEPKLTPLMH